MKKTILWVVLGIVVIALGWMVWKQRSTARKDDMGRETVSKAGVKEKESVDRSKQAATRVAGREKEIMPSLTEKGAPAGKKPPPPSIKAEDIVSLAQWAELVRAGADAGELMDWLDDFLFSEPDAVTRLRAMLRGEDVAFRLKVAQWLGRLGTAQAAELLVGLVNDETDSRAEAEYSDILAAWRSANAVDALLASLSDANTYMANLGCTRALGGLMSESLAVKLLDVYFTSTNENIRQLAADAVCHVTDSEATPALVGLLANTTFLAPDDPFRAAAYNALAAIGTEVAVEVLFKDAQIEESRNRTSILEAIGLVNNEDALDLVIAQAGGGAGTSDPEIQAAAIRALGNYGIEEDRIRQLLLHLSAYETDPAVINAANRTLRILSGDDAGE